MLHCYDTITHLSIAVFCKITVLQTPDLLVDRKFDLIALMILSFTIHFPLTRPKFISIWHCE